MKHTLLFLILCLILLNIFVNCIAEEQKTAKYNLYNGGFFTIEIPEGWEVITAGSCSTFSFIIRDPRNPIRRLFYFGQVGPVYLKEYQRQIDYRYMGMGGFPIQWINMPTVDPLTAENFLKNFSLIARSPLAQGFIRGVPELNNLEIISSSAQPSLLMAAEAKIIRALFREFQTLGEGMFYVSAAPLIPYDGFSPGAGIGYGFCCTGINSDKKDFVYWEPALLRSLRSFKIAPSYINNCKQSQQEMWNRILEINKIWDEISDTINKSWEYRSQVDDILSEKRSDAILGKERLYDPDTGEVYEFEAGFYDKYDLHRGQYKKTDLELLPDNNWELWGSPTKDGYSAI